MIDPDAVVNRVERFARARRLLLPGPVVVSVSGGQDSLCMLDVLARIAPRFRIELHVAHLDHHFRGAQSAEEAEFVFGFAVKMGLPADVATVDVPAYRTRHHLSKQVAARYARYQFLCAVASASGAAQVAVGHTADDSAETFLMNLLRGAGLAGLTGLSPRRPVERGQLGPSLAVTDWLTPPLPPGAAPLPLVVRPLLQLSRDETGEYCRARGFPFRSDPSNMDTGYRRNWVRSDLLPAMESRVPGAARRLGATADLLSGDWEIVSGLVDDLWRDVVSPRHLGLEIDLPAFLAIELPLQAHLLRRAIAAVAGSLEEISRVHLDSILAALRDGQVGATIDLPANIYMEKRYNSLWIARSPDVSKPAGLPPDGVRLPVPGVVTLPVGTIEAELSPADALPARQFRSESRYDACLDADIVGETLLVRRRRPGDRFVPLGMREPKKLQDFLVDQKVPRAERDSVPLVVNTDAIVWVAGYRIDDRFKVTPETRNVLIVKLRGTGDGD